MDLSWIWGNARIRFAHHQSTVKVHLENGDAISLSDICRASTPPCRLNPLLFNGHLQTIWTSTKSTDIPIYYKRKLFSASEPEYAGTFAVDFAVPPYEGADPTLPKRTTYYSDEEYANLGSDDSKPMLFALHGLSGGSYEVYLRAVLEPLIAAGWEVCVVNSRGCAMSKITTGVLYNARATWDVRQVVKWAREKWPQRKLFGIGFSLGANILTNYLGEEGDNCLLEAAVVCSSPWNLELSNHALQRSWLNLEIYSRTMGTNMKKLFETHIEQIAKNPRVDIEKVRRIRYLHEFDRELQGPTWGYPTEGAYYRDASSVDSLFAVRIPLFAISAEDDPIVHQEALPWLEVMQNPYAVLCTTSTGGHLSWFEIGGTRWFAKPASQFLMRMANAMKIDRPGYMANGPSSKAVQIDTNPAPFLPMRRKLRMPIDS